MLDSERDLIECRRLTPADIDQCALFGRDTGHGGRSYGRHDMIHVLDIDPRIARRCLHAGRLQAGA